MSLYVQLSRAERWDGLHLFREPKNVLDSAMRDTVFQLERLGDETRRRFERDRRHESWFREWNMMNESDQSAAAADEDEALLW